MVQADRRRFTDRASRLNVAPITRDITLKQDRLTQLAEKLDGLHSKIFADHRQNLDGMARLLDTLSYKSTLERGYAVVRSGTSVVTSKSEAAKAGKLEIQFADGTYDVSAGPAPVRAKPSKAKTKTDDQGSLF